MFPVLVKKVSGCGCDAVDLGEGTDSEKTDSGAEEGENLAQPAPVFTHTVFDVVERSAEYMAAFINGAVLDGQYTFCVLGSHTEQGRDPHPEQCSGTAGNQCRGHTDDITGTDGGGQCGTQRLELGDGLISGFGMFRYMFVVEDTADCVLEPVPDMG